MRLFRSSVILLALLSCFGLPQLARAQQPSPDTSDIQQLYGSWYIYPRGNPDTDPIREEFRHDTATGKDVLAVTRLCQGNYRAVIASAISPIEITPSTIRVLKSATTTEKGELHSECRSSVEAGLYSYTLSPDGTHLTLTNTSGKPVIIDLIRQDTSSAAVLPASIYGTWLMPAQVGGDTRIESRLVFYSSADGTNGKVRQIVTCMKADKSVTAQADSNIRVIKDRIDILNNASYTQRDGPYSCEANITAGTLRYVLAPGGATMTLYASGGGRPLKLTRDHGRGLN